MWLSRLDLSLGPNALAGKEQDLLPYGVMRSALLAACALVTSCVVEDKLPGAGEPIEEAEDGGGSDDSSDSGDGTTPPSGLNVRVLVVDEDGSAMAHDTFSGPDDVYFALQIDDATRPVVAEDYVFQIVASDGGLLSQDGFACRVFHVNARGLIDSVQSFSGGDCVHETSRTGDGRLLVRAKPFERPETNSNGAQRVTLRIENVANCRSDSDFAGALAADFALEPDGDGKGGRD